MPLKRTNQSQNARQRVFVSVLMVLFLNVLDSWKGGKLQLKLGWISGLRISRNWV